jgi:hypothetical protein
MSALDDIKEQARTALGSLDEAARSAGEASADAESLAEDAARRGWQAVASTMSSVRETLDLVVSAIDDAMKTTSSGQAVLGAITEQMSSNEVAVLLGQAAEAYATARSEAGVATETLSEVRADADGAGAETTSSLIRDAESHLSTGREALKTATDGTQSEEALANDWGAEVAVMGGSKRLVYVASPKHGKEDHGAVSKAPEDGQGALDRSVAVSPETSRRRVGVDPVNNEIVVFDETRPGQEEFHGHVRSWEKLRPKQRSVLLKAGLTDRRGRIVQ